MDKVTPKKIVSPFSGEWSTPKIIDRDYGDRIVREAHWYCPASGQYITRGVVETIIKDKKSYGNKPKQ
tara:strand:- start:2027 stop:2230 length:204 start_codon:yes stop_codon:yes gene_type:complete